MITSKLHIMYIIFMNTISSFTSKKIQILFRLTTYSTLGSRIGRRSSEQYYIISKFWKISRWMMKNIIFRRVTDDVEEFFSFVKENRIFYHLYNGLYLWRNNYMYYCGVHHIFTYSFSFVYLSLRQANFPISR